MEGARPPLQNAGLHEGRELPQDVADPLPGLASGESGRERRARRIALKPNPQPPKEETSAGDAATLLLPPPKPSVLCPSSPHPTEEASTDGEAVQRAEARKGWPSRARHAWGPAPTGLGVDSVSLKPCELTGEQLPPNVTCGQVCAGFPDCRPAPSLELLASIRRFCSSVQIAHEADEAVAGALGHFHNAITERLAGRDHDEDRD